MSIFTRYRVITDCYWLLYWFLRLTGVTVTGNVHLSPPNENQMDTDEDGNQPAPGAKPGTMMNK